MTMKWGRIGVLHIKAAWLLPLVVAFPLSGCLSGDQGVEVFEVPPLPDNFSATYVTDNGVKLTLRGQIERTMDRFGGVGEQLLVATDPVSQGGGTWMFDACGAPGWQATQDDDRIKILKTNSTDPVWLSAQGVRLSPGTVLAEGLTVSTVRQNGFTVLADGPDANVVYGTDPVPTQWTVFGMDRTWTLDSFEGGPPRSCSIPPRVDLAFFGRDGPSSMPAFPQVSMKDTLAYLRGPLGPPAFLAWEQEHANGRMQTAQFTPPLFSAVPDEMHPASWSFRFVEPERSSDLIANCVVDDVDTLVPSEFRPLRCSAGEETPDEDTLEAPNTDVAFPDGSRMAEHMVDIGLPPSALVATVDGNTSMLEIASWEKQTDANGIQASIYFARWNQEGRLVWASLPADLALLGTTE